MLEILKYIFSSFWVFGGTVILIWSVGLMFAIIFYAIFGDSKKIWKFKEEIVINNGTAPAILCGTIE